MDDETAKELLVINFAQGEIHRAFLRILLRRLAIDVPGFSLDLLSEQLHILVANADPPHTAPNPQQRLLRETGHEELRKLIEMVEQAIAETRDTES